MRDEQTYQAEQKLSDAYYQISKAHALLAAAACTEGKARALAESESDEAFDKAEELIREAFNVNSVHVARYTNPGQGRGGTRILDRVEEALDALYKFQIGRAREILKAVRDEYR